MPNALVLNSTTRLRLEAAAKQHCVTAHQMLHDALNDWLDGDDWDRELEKRPRPASVRFSLDEFESSLWEKSRGGKLVVMPAPVPAAVAVAAP